MAIVQRATFYEGPGKTSGTSTIHFSVKSATDWIMRMAKVHGWRRFGLESVEVDIPGMDGLEGALDNSSPHYLLYRKQIDEGGYLKAVKAYAENERERTTS